MVDLGAMRRAFKDAEFHREYKKLTGEDPIRRCRKRWRKRSEKWRAEGELVELGKSDSAPRKR